MRVATAAQMRGIDERAQSEFGITAEQLMEEAGRAIAQVAIQHFAPQRVCVVCGKGIFQE